MISKQIEKRKDGRSSASDALRYGEGLAPDRETGELLDKSHRTRFGNFGLIDDGVYAGRELAEMAEMIDCELAFPAVAYVPLRYSHDTGCCDHDV